MSRRSSLKERPEQSSSAASEYKGRWGEHIRPRFPYTVGHIFQGWRDNRIVADMLVLRCPCCSKIFFIMRQECQKELMCPRGCGVVANYVVQKDELLVELLEEIIQDGSRPSSKRLRG